MTLVAEAYFHLRPYPVDSDDLQRLGRDASRIAAEAGLRFFEPHFEVEVRLASGSLKAWARVFGPYILAGATFVANYKGFKEGVSEMVADAQSFGSFVNRAFIQEHHVPPRKVVRTERRTKTPGKLLRVLKRREWLMSHRDQLTPIAVAREQAVIDALMQQVMVDLSPNEQVVLMKVLGEPVPEPPMPEPDRVAISKDQERQGSFFDPYPDTEPTPDDYYARFRLSDFSTSFKYPLIKPQSSQPPF